MNKRNCIFSLIVLVLLAACADEELLSKQESIGRPNILLIVADDLGFSDLGVYGSEIKTPNIDRLAEDGLQLTQFYSGATCSPSRSMLLTGKDHHLVGLGTMKDKWDVNQIGAPGYEGYLNKQALPVSELLNNSGYHTYIAGKWHLGSEPGFRPSERGFERSFTLLSGGASHFSDATGLARGRVEIYLEDGQEVKLPDDFYSSRFYTDKLIEYIDQGRSDGKPFFGYLSYTAPHWPLQVPDSYIDRYQGKYAEGYDVIRQRRIANLEERFSLKLGGGPAVTVRVPKWEELSNEQRLIEARKMEVYAAMVENLDFNIGRVVEYLDSVGELDNTFIVFLSDNGAEGNELGRFQDNTQWIPERFDNSLANIGRVSSYIYQGPQWAQVSNGPLRNYKSHITEGGIRVPAIIRYKPFGDKKRISNAFMTVKDIAPTLIDISGFKEIDTAYSHEIVASMTGRSMLPFLLGEDDRVHEEDYIFGWEIFGRKAIRQGDWKLLQQVPPYGNGQWQLYNIENDLGEANDVAATYPDKVRRLSSYFQDYIQDNGVVLPSSGEKPYVPLPSTISDKSVD